MVMKLEAIARGTTTNPDLTPSRRAFDAIKIFKKKMGIVFILASGRPLSFFINYPEILEVCDAIVAENGAVIFYPKSSEKILMGSDISGMVKEILERLNVPADFFEVIISINRSYEKLIIEALKSSGLPVDVEFNVDSMMILPRGVSKLNGVLEALRRMGYGDAGFMAFGDGENDLMLMSRASIAIAVANAIPEIKRIAHYVTSKPYGDGVAEFLELLIKHHEPQ